MAVRAVVFDIGGVLESTPALGWETTWSTRLGLTPAGFYERTYPVWRAGSIGAISETDVHRRLGDLLGLAEPQVNALMRDMWTEYLGTLNADLAEYFRGLRPRYRTAILSNSFVGAREREHECYGFGDITDLIVYSHEVGMSKPDPRIYELTCERLGVRPDEVVFVDDVEPIVEAARQVGMHGVLFKNNEQAIAEIEAACHGGCRERAG